MEAPFQGPLGGSETAGGSPLAGLAPALAATPETAPAPGVAPGTSAAPGGANAEGGTTTGAPERVAADGTAGGATARTGDPATAAASAARGAEPPATVEAPSEGRPANGARSQESAAPNTDRAAEVMRQVRMELAPGMRSAVVHLSPPELGRIHIRIRFHKDQLSAVVRAEHAETLDALERHLPELRAVLAQQGIEAGELDLGLGFSEDAPRREPAGSSSRQTSTPADAPATSLVLPRELAQQAAALDGGIDTYA